RKSSECFNILAGHIEQVCVFDNICNSFRNPLDTKCGHGMSRKWDAKRSRVPLLFVTPSTWSYHTNPQCTAPVWAWTTTARCQECLHCYIVSATGAATPPPVCVWPRAVVRETCMILAAHMWELTSR